MSSFPTCKICRKDFTSRSPTPFVLPCLHAVCEVCVKSNSVIFCPSCDVCIDHKRTPFHKDHVRKREILQMAIKERPEQLLCTHEDDGNRAVCWCQDCEEMLCEHCQRMHQSFKVTQGHTILDVDQAMPITEAEVKNCSIHKRYPLDTFDKTCKIFICVRCIREDHAHHETVDIEKLEEGFKTILQNQLKEIITVERHEEAMLKKTLNHMTSIQKVESETKRKVIATFQTLRELLNKREEEVLQSLEQETQKSILEAQVNKKKIITKQAECKRVKEYVTLVLHYPNLQDVLPIRTIIEDKTRILVSTKSKAETMYTLPNFNPSGEDTLKSFISYIGEVGAIQEQTPDAAPVKVNTTSCEPRQPIAYSRCFLLQQQFTKLSVQEPSCLRKTFPEIIPDEPFSVPEGMSSERSAVSEYAGFSKNFLKPMYGILPSRAGRPQPLDSDQTEIMDERETEEIHEVQEKTVVQKALKKDIQSADLRKEVNDVVSLLKKSSTSDKGKTRDNNLATKDITIGRHEATHKETSQPQGMHPRAGQRYMTPTAQPNQMYPAMYQYMGQTQGQGYPAAASVMVQKQGPIMYQQSQRMPTPQYTQIPQIAAATAAQYPNQATQQYGSTTQFQAVYCQPGGQVPIAQPARPLSVSGMTTPTGTLQIIDPNSGQLVQTELGEAKTTPPSVSARSTPVGRQTAETLPPEFVPGATPTMPPVAAESAPEEPVEDLPNKQQESAVDEPEQVPESEPLKEATPEPVKVEAVGSSVDLVPPPEQTSTVDLSSPVDAVVEKSEEPVQVEVETPPVVEEVQRGLWE